MDTNSPADRYAKATAEQKKVIFHDTGHSKVVAVAGSGKTQTMIYRIDFLLDQGVDPARIMTVMFNRSAKTEFAERLKRFCNRFSGLPEVRTFHSLGKKICEILVAKGVIPAATLMTEDGEVTRMLRNALKAGAEDDVPGYILNDGQTLEAFMNFVDLCKSSLMEPVDMFDTMQLREDYRFFLRAFDCFEQERADRKLRTFADLIYDPVRALNLDKSQIRHIENKFSHVIIDEYQDVNEIQQTMMRWITGTRAEVMVIGDPSQCIYVWRGAKPEYIVSGFERDFGACKTYQLSRTFRYGHRISNLANHCINQNRDRPDALCLSAPSTPDSKITCLDESQGIGPIIDAWRQQGRKLEEIAVLPRLFSMAAGIEMELLDKGTPYRLVGSESILESPITNAVLGFMHLCHKTLAQHPRLPALVKAMLTVPPLGITQGEIKEAGYKIINAPQLASQVLTQMAAFAKPFQAGNLRKRAQIFNLFASISPDAKAETAIKQFASESGAVAFFSKSPTAEAADEKAKIIEALVFYAKKGDLTIRQFIAAIAKMEQAMQKLEDADDALLITSIHRAKGLEWPVVFIPGLKDGSFPFFSAERPMTRRAIEDERRLYYVGVTRAKEHLYLMHPRDASLAQAMTAGAQTHPEHPLASRFLFESNISLSSAVGTALANPSTFVFRPAEHPGVANRYMKELGCALEIPQTPPAVTVALRQVPPATPPPSVVYDGSRFALGDRVEHPKFGSGTVRGFREDDRMMEVLFNGDPAPRVLMGTMAVRAGLRRADAPETLRI